MVMTSKSNWYAFAWKGVGGRKGYEHVTFFCDFVLRVIATVGICLPPMYSSVSGCSKGTRNGSEGVSRKYGWVDSLFRGLS